MSPWEDATRNRMTWERVHKTRYTALEIEFGVYYAIVNFNCSRKATLDIPSQLKLNPGIYKVNNYKKLNQQRIAIAAYKGRDSTEKILKDISGQKKVKLR